MLLHGCVLCFLCGLFTACGDISYYEQRSKSDMCRGDNVIKLDRSKIHAGHCESGCEGEYWITVCDDPSAYLEP